MALDGETKEPSSKRFWMKGGFSSLNGVEANEEEEEETESVARGRTTRGKEKKKGKEKRGGDKWLPEPLQLLQKQLLPLLTDGLKKRSSPFLYYIRRPQEELQPSSAGVYVCMGGVFERLDEEMAARLDIDRAAGPAQPVYMYSGRDGYSSLHDWVATRNGDDDRCDEGEVENR